MSIFINWFSVIFNIFPKSITTYSNTKTYVLLGLWILKVSHSKTCYEKKTGIDIQEAIISAQVIYYYHRFRAVGWHAVVTPAPSNSFESKEFLKIFFGF